MRRPFLRLWLLVSSRRFVVAGLVTLVVVLGIVMAFGQGIDAGMNALVAVGTLVVAFVAVFGDWIRTAIVPPKLGLELCPPTLTEFRDVTTQEKVAMGWYFSFKVCNLRRWRRATNCRVMLTAIDRPNGSGGTQPEPMSISLPFQWAVVPVSPLSLTVGSHGEVVNFGRLREGKSFEPVLVSLTFNFRHTVEPNETAWFSVQIRADDLVSEHCQIFKVSWDGQWSDRPEEIVRHVLISEVFREQLGV